MDIVQLKKDIKNKDFRKLYIFAGEEIGLMNMYIKQMSPEPIRVDTVAEIYTKLVNKQLGGTRKVYVVRDDKHFTSNEKAYTDLESRMKDNILIYCMTNEDKRSKFYKMYKDDIVVFHKLTTAQLKPIVSKMINVPNIEYFIEACNNDYNTICNNVDKLIRLDTVTYSKELIDDIIGICRVGNSFKYAEYVMRKDATAILELELLLSQGENGIALMGLLYKQVRESILVFGNKDAKEGVSSATGINGWVCKQILSNTRMKPTELLKCLRLIKKYDGGVKTGIYSDSFAIQALTVELLNI